MCDYRRCLSRIATDGTGRGQRRPDDRPGLLDRLRKSEDGVPRSLFVIASTCICPWSCDTSRGQRRRSERPWIWSCGARRSGPRRWPPSATPCWAGSIRTWSPSCTNWPRWATDRPEDAGRARTGRPRDPPATLAEWQARKDGWRRTGPADPRDEPGAEAPAADRRAVALDCPRGRPGRVRPIRRLRLPGRARPGRATMEAGRATWPSSCPPAKPDDVRMIDLGEAEPIDRMIADFRAGIIGEAERESTRDMTKRPDRAPGRRRRAAAGQACARRCSTSWSGLSAAARGCCRPRRRPDPAPLRGPARRRRPPLIDDYRSAT